MFLIQWTLITILVLVTSCQNTSKKSDDADISLLRKDHEIQRYILARSMEKSAKASSCDNYKALALSQTFVLKDLALLRAHINCEDTSSLPEVTQTMIQDSPFYQKIDLQRLSLKSEKEKDYKLKIQVLIKKSQFSDRNKEKVDFLQAALNIAIDNNDAELKQDLDSRLTKVAPRFIENPTSEMTLKIAQDWMNQRQFAKARTLFEKVINSKNFGYAEKLQAQKNLRFSYKLDQKKDQYIVFAEKVTNWILKQYKTIGLDDIEKSARASDLNDSYSIWARSLWTDGRNSQAEKALEQAVKNLKGSSRLAEIYFIKARMQEEGMNYSGAIESFNKALVDIKEKSTLYYKIQFSKGWNLRKLGQFQDAKLIFKSLKEETQDPFDKNRFHFWYAKTLKSALQDDEANLEFANLTALDPIGFYGLLSFRELNIEMPPLKSTTPLAEIQIDDSIKNFIDALVVTEESDVLERFLKYKTQNLKLETSAPEWLFYLKSYARAGLYLPLFSQIGTLSSDLKSKQLSENPYLLFPKKFDELIEHNAEKFAIESELIYSIIRQESAFNPLARSPADAFGLMQLIPSTAREQQSLTGISISHFEDLYKPEVNIPIGASLLKSLSEKYNGQLILMSAAYNAGDKAVLNWVNSRFKEDPIEFIEDIPYDETRSYVKLILRNFIFYSRLKQPELKTKFPNQCLQGLQAFKSVTERISTSH